MKTIHQWFDAYGESHQNPTNKLFHWICIPAIMFSLIGLLTSIPSDFLPFQPYLNFGTLFVLFVLVFYLRLSVPIALTFVPVAILLILGNVWVKSLAFMPLWQFSILVFVIAWIGQFIGHKIEGKKPSFFDDLQFLLIGPAWLAGFVLKSLNISY